MDVHPPTPCKTCPPQPTQGWHSMQGLHAAQPTMSHNPPLMKSKTLPQVSPTLQQPKMLMSAQQPQSEGRPGSAMTSNRDVMSGLPMPPTLRPSLLLKSITAAAMPAAVPTATAPIMKALCPCFAGVLPSILCVCGPGSGPGAGAGLTFRSFDETFWSIS
jgi:hypothetical protein